METAGEDPAKGAQPDTQSGVPDSHTVMPTPDASDHAVVPEALRDRHGKADPPVQCLNGPV